jgi:colicin import membrane protein
MTEVPVPDRAFRWSLAGHGLLLVLVLMGGLSLPRSPPPTQLAIKASVVDPNATRPSSPVRPKPLPEAKAAPKPESKPKPELEERRVEQQKQEKDRQQAAQREKAVQEKQRTDQIKAQQAAEKQEKQEKQEREKKQEKEKKEREKAATEKLQAEKLKSERLKADRLREEAAEREIARQLEAEERLLAATESGALADYVGMIGQKVTRSWIRPPSARAGLECEVVVNQIPGGEVVGVKVERCNGDEAVRRSIEAAVLKASPLPLPDDPSLFDRSLRFTFKPEQ